ncbi:GxxExxY protein [Persicimonas caeni]|jgi:GxxExxY protein|uniref:GxxExxY protein n=1 Tax=Persicimonas caeni TaxID=2292766 RepID=A0A4Y6PV74_PERCE|nr:GxxExxY protein [Persicimonas caeni]QDG51645.1 GxxExxY protein [Persicimonas caeni]QED32866.1 GxxExxY protein [Persicimonas caeni]
MAYHEEVANDVLTETIIGKAIDIHKNTAPGLRESLYQELLCEALRDEGIACEMEHSIEIEYAGRTVTTGRADLWIADTVVVELKVVKQITDEHYNQLGRYVKAADATRGLVLNFGSATVGIRRYTNFELLEAGEGVEAVEGTEDREGIEA